MSKITKIKDVKFQEHNLNQGTEFGDRLLEKSLTKFGFREAGTLDKDGNIISGNHRTEKAGQLGMDDVQVFKGDPTKVTFIQYDDIDINTVEGKELALALNQTAKTNIRIDEVMAVEQLGEIAVEWGIDVEEELNIDPEDDDYEIPKTIKTDIVIGDLFEIGEHRLLCGDSTDSDAVEGLAAGKTMDIMVTDPPYGVSYQGKTKEALTIKNDAMSKDDTHQLWRDAFNTALIFLKDGGSIYATAPPGPLQVGFMQVMLEADCLRQCMVWNKGQMVLGHSDYHYQHEPVLYGWKPGKSHYFINDRTKTTVFDVKNPNRNGEHPTMKPLELWSEFLINSSKPKDIAYDPFLGSGTTMVAAHQLKRKYYGVELDPKYCQVIIDRMVKLDPDLKIKRNGKDWRPK